jgi:iron(III) transport system ATP-binding protein
MCVNVAKSYNNHPVLADVNLEAQTGSLTALLGSSGSGKTTLLRAVMGFVPLERGHIVVAGVTVADGETNVPTERRGVGYVAQEGALFPHLSVGRNVGFGLDREQRRSSPRIDEVLELVGLDSSYSARNPAELSGGEQRRVALARALAPKPKVVLLDEPFNGLDASLRAETRDAVSRALAHEGTTSLLVTHDQAEALSMGKRVAVLRDGVIAQSGLPSELYETPLDLRMAKFLGDVCVLEATASGNTATSALGTVTLRNSCHGPVQLALRPEQIAIGSSGAPATVDRCEYFGRQTIVHLSTESGVQLIAGVVGGTAIEAGTSVYVEAVGEVMAYPI